MTHRLRLGVMALIGLLSWAGLAGDSEIFQPRSTADFGSGATIWTDWYTPGGIGGVGAFAGHPNTLSRNDRVLVRFNLSRLLTWPAERVSRQTATFRFRVARVAGQAAVRQIEVVHLKYDPWRLTGSDLVNQAVETVGTVEVRQDDVPGRVYALPVTQAVREDLLRGNPFCGFRFRDVEAERQGNPDITPTGVEISFGDKGPVLEVKDPAWMGSHGE